MSNLNIEGAGYPFEYRGEFCSPISIAELNIYPIKSIGGIPLEAAEVTERGFRIPGTEIEDRELMLVDESGRYITQRQKPRMALIKPQVSENGLLTVTALGMSELLITPTDDGERKEVTILQEGLLGVEQNLDASQWFSDFLGIKCKLIKMPADYNRQVDPLFARNEEDQVAYADGFPYTLVSKGALNYLNYRLFNKGEEALPMNRFRPNFVIDGVLPHEEDLFRTIRIGNAVFYIAKSNIRCRITLTNQDTAELGKEPLRTLKEYRWGTRIKDGESGILFAQNLVPANPGQIIRLYDNLEVLERTDAPDFTLKIAA